MPPGEQPVRSAVEVDGDRLVSALGQPRRQPPKARPQVNDAKRSSFGELGDATNETSERMPPDAPFLTVTSRDVPKRELFVVGRISLDGPTLPEAQRLIGSSKSQELRLPRRPK